MVTDKGDFIYFVFYNYYMNIRSLWGATVLILQSGATRLLQMRKNEITKCTEKPCGKGDEDMMLVIIFSQSTHTVSGVFCCCFSLVLAHCCRVTTQNVFPFSFFLWISTTVTISLLIKIKVFNGNLSMGKQQTQPVGVFHSPLSVCFVLLSPAQNMSLSLRVEV